jgi:hypothetical protein
MLSEAAKGMLSEDAKGMLSELQTGLLLEAAEDNVVRSCRGDFFQKL